MKLIDAIEAASGIEADKQHVAEIPGDVKQTWADVSKAKELLGYNPNFDLKQGLNNFVSWYKSDKFCQ